MQQYQQAFPSFIDSDGKIFIQQGYQGNQHIGWICSKYDEMSKIAKDAIEKADAYKKQLIDAGIIKPTLTPEEQIAALTQQVAALGQQVTTLTGLLASKERSNDINSPDKQSS
jgi:hypothetical protein